MRALGSWPRPVTACLGLVLLASPITAVLAQTPHRLLFGATLDEARDFAVETALGRGWSVPAVGTTSVTFEQILEAGDPEDSSIPIRLVRIRASFDRETAGVRVTLHASEVEVQPDTGQEWSRDLTLTYAENLENALSSLGLKWDQRPGADTRGAGRLHAPETHRDAAAASATDRIGVWAYDAERYAERAGCALTDRPTRLESAGADWERHRVECARGGALRVLCLHGDCTTAP